MSRTVKVRAWDDLQKVYMKATYGGEEPRFDENGVYEIDVPSYWTLEQFTGLVDRNGIEIYEGDIVQLFGEDCEAPPCYRYVGAITWNPETLGYSVEGREIGGDPDDGGIPALRASGYVVALLGNIHQNPELLST